MSDEEERMQGPAPSLEWLRGHRERLVAEDDAREEQGMRALLGEYEAMARRLVDAFASLPCEGSLERISECSDAFAITCERLDSPSCPRQIRAFDESRRRQEIGERMAEAGLSVDDIAEITARGLSVDDASTLLRMLTSGVQLDAALSALCEFFVTAGTTAVDRFLADRGKRALVLAGDVGTGKSVAAGYALRRRAGMFLSCSELTEAARFGDESDARRQRLFKAPILVLDDVGTEKDWVLPLVESLLVERHNDRLRTIVTCNMNAGDFGRRYGVRVADRVANYGMFFVLKGDSLRGRR